MTGLQPDKSLSRWLRSINKVCIFYGVGQIELAATVEACDLGIIPPRDRARIRGMSLKFYEYVAGGVPVFAVDHPPTREWPMTEYASVIPNMGGRPVEGPREGARSGSREAAIHPRGCMGTAPETGGRRGRPRPSDPRVPPKPQLANGDSHATLVALLGLAKAEASARPDENVAPTQKPTAPHQVRL
jgi:hypothetical protein